MKCEQALFLLLQNLRLPYVDRMSLKTIAILTILKFISDLFRIIVKI